MDSPVLKPPLIHISSARLIGTVATTEADEGQDAAFPDEDSTPGGSAPGAAASPLNAPFDAPDGSPFEAPIDALADAPVDALVDTPVDPPVDPPVDAAPFRRIGSTSTAIEDDWQRQAYERAASRLREIERQVADAETRLAEAQELFEKLEREADLACARAEEARQQATAIQEAARQEGYRAGVEQAENEMSERLAAVAALAEGAVHARTELLQHAEPEVIDLVFEIARKVLGQHLALDKGAVAEVARRALSIAGQAEMYYLHLHPDDAELVERHLLRDTLGMPLQVVEDERLDPGNCLVRTAHGRVNAGIEVQLREIREQMVGAA